MNISDQLRAQSTKENPDTIKLPFYLFRKSGLFFSMEKRCAIDFRGPPDLAQLLVKDSLQQKRDEFIGPNRQGRIHRFQGSGRIASSPMQRGKLHPGVEILGLALRDLFQQPKGLG